MAGEFLPMVFSSGGMMGDTAKYTINTIAAKLISKTDEDSMKMQRIIKSDIRFSLIRARINTLRNPKNSIHDQLRSLNSSIL